MEQLRNIFESQGQVDAIIDTDVYNEVDDYFAIAYLFGHPERFRVKGITIAPFFNYRVESIRQGIARSTQDTLELLRLMGKDDFTQVYPGGDAYLPDEATPVESEAADFMIRESRDYGPENRLYVIAIGAITTVASAILKDPSICRRIAVVWLGGHDAHQPLNTEFNLIQDVAAARVVMSAQVPFLQVPCVGVASALTTGYYELEHFLKGKNPLCQRLFEKTTVVGAAESRVPTWSRVIWDVVAVAAVCHGSGQYLSISQVPRRLPGYGDGCYGPETDLQMLRVDRINRDHLLYELFCTLYQF